MLTLTAIILLGEREQSDVPRVLLYKACTCTQRHTSLTKLQSTAKSHVNRQAQGSQAKELLSRAWHTYNQSTWGTETTW